MILRFGVGFLAGVVLGIALLLVGGITWQPPPPKCPHCAVLSQPWHSCNEAVVGGWVCP